MTTKVCTRCKVEKSIEEFYVLRKGKTPVQSKCKLCCANMSGYQREWRKKNPDKARNSELKKNHGITLADYEVILGEQGGCCAVCGKAPGSVGSGSNSKGTLAVDHCHQVGVIRGLLCTNCNLGIGSFYEDSNLLRNAAAYLDSHRELIAKIIARKSVEQAEAKATADRLLDELMQ